MEPQSIVPEKLREGQQLTVVSPSRPLSIIDTSVQEIALQRLAAIGLAAHIPRQLPTKGALSCADVVERARELHAAFTDPATHGVISAIGGYNSNQLLRHLDFDLIRRNPKPFCGFSDISALTLALFAKTGMVTYSGPHFSTFGMAQGIDYTLDLFQRCLLRNEQYHIEPSAQWSEDAWYLNQDKRDFFPNSGPTVITTGEAHGIIIGGNLCTLNLLQGTEYMPPLNDSILFLEDTVKEGGINEFDRDLQSLLHTEGFGGVRGLVLGRFGSRLAKSDLIEVLRSKSELQRIPVIIDASFGHTSPIATFPIGGSGSIGAGDLGCSICIERH